MTITRLRQAHLDEPCPKCVAGPKERCVTPGGKFTSKPHAGRIENGNILYLERLQSGYYAQS